MSIQTALDNSTPSSRKSFTDRYQDFWNSLTPPKRAALLNTAGVPVNRCYQHRSWPYIPADVRTDVIYTIKLFDIDINNIEAIIQDVNRARVPA